MAQIPTAPATRRKPLYKLLYVQVLCAIVLGGLLGWLAPHVATNEWIKALGDGFIKLIKMLIAPIIFCTVVSGIAHIQDAKKVGRVGIKALVYFEVVSTFALVIGLLVANIARPGDEVRLCAVVSGLHTAVVAGVDAPIDVPDGPDERAAREREAEAFMTSRFGPALAASPGVAHRYEVLRFLTDAGSVADAVGARAAETGAALVAVASHHKSRLAKLFSGSVSERLAATCPVPLLLIS